ncbi:MAG: hypothetical protein ABIL40_06145 [candidate division WOR-3 bacterium]
MDKDILIEWGICHECGNEFVILSSEVKPPAKMNRVDDSQGFRCPYCGSKNFEEKDEYSITLSKKQLEELSFQLSAPSCVHCGKVLLLTGEREDLKFEIKFADGYSAAYEYVPFCRKCLGTLSDDVLIKDSKRWLEDRGPLTSRVTESGVQVPEYTYENLKKGMKRKRI